MIEANTITASRLRNQHLLLEPLASATEVVRWLGAVQAQDYAGAKWALGLRTRGATDATIDRLFDDGAILRTHVMRPTWHFVLPEDARWLLELTGPRVRAGLRGRHVQLELSNRDIARAIDLFGGALAGGRSLTRAELASTLRSGGLAPDGQRLPHLVLCAELERVIISGPRRGRQFTWALFEHRAPGGRPLEREEAMVQLVCRYLRSHGPAQVQDFCWWSGLTLAEARRAIAGAGRDLAHLTLDGTQYWLGAGSPTHPDTFPQGGVAHLLPNWDEYTVGYRDRSAALHADDSAKATLLPFGSILANVVTIDGRVRGGWTKTLGPEHVQVMLRPFGALSAAELDAVNTAAQRFGHFLERPVTLQILPASGGLGGERGVFARG